MTGSIRERDGCSFTSIDFLFAWWLEIVIGKVFEKASVLAILCLGGLNLPIRTATERNSTRRVFIILSFGVPRTSRREGKV